MEKIFFLNFISFLLGKLLIFIIWVDQFVSFYFRGCNVLILLIRLYCSSLLESWRNGSIYFLCCECYVGKRIGCGGDYEIFWGKMIIQSRQHVTALLEAPSFNNAIGPPIFALLCAFIQYFIFLGFFYILRENFDCFEKVTTPVCGLSIISYRFLKYLPLMYCALCRKCKNHERFPIKIKTFFFCI